MAHALVIFKPDAAYRLAARQGLWQWLRLQHGWKLTSLKWFKAPPELVENHYDFLRGRPFFPWLVEFMSALPLPVGTIDATPKVLEEMRFELGETRINQSRPGSLRERFGIYGGINCMHLSDSPESGTKEVKLWSKNVDFDGVDTDLGVDGDVPDHTFHLRSLAAQYAAGTHKELAEQEMRGLLKEEAQVSDETVATLAKIILGGLS